MPIFMNYSTINGETGQLACANNLHVQLGQQQIAFSQLQSAFFSWDEKSNGGVVNGITWTWNQGGDVASPRWWTGGFDQAPPSDVVQQLQQLAGQLRPYMAASGKITVPGVNTPQAAANFCNGAKIPTSMLQVSGNSLVSAVKNWG